MKIRLTTMAAVGTGYYLGSKAGAQRYNQIVWLSRSVANSRTFHRLMDKIRGMLASVMEALTGERPDFAPAPQQGLQSQQGQQS